MTGRAGHKVVIAAGGTGGHMFPALALARELRGRGQEVLLACDARGARYVGPELPHHEIRAGSPSGRPLRRLAGVCVRELEQIGDTIVTEPPRSREDARGW